MAKQKDPNGESDTSDRTASIRLPVPTPDPSLFKHKATNDILGLLLDNPYEVFTIRELSRATDHSTYSVKSAVDVLEANGIVITRREGNRRPVGINRSRLNKPDDPVLRIPQTEYHEPVREALDRIRDELNDVRGIMIFGSVARGRADRRSDIDLWVLVRESRGEQHRAHEIAKELGEKRFAGDRYEFQILVESIDSARSYADRLDEIVTEGITLHDSETLRAIKQEVLSDAG